jgi:[protein-PII] uridylyltransferase
MVPIPTREQPPCLIAVSASDRDHAPLISRAILEGIASSPQECVQELRGAIREAREELARRFEGGVPVARLVHQHAEVIDEVLSRLWRAQMGNATDGPALVAAGGYGRSELHPASDIDIMVLLGGQESAEQRRRIEQFLTLLWDLGIEVGHSVRTVVECVEEAAGDLTVATNLMETRLLEGPPALFEGMREAISPGKVWPSAEFFQAKWQEQRVRYRRYGDTGYNLEPNVKEGPGGLRDIQTIGWVLKRHFGADNLMDLVKEGFLTDSECRTLVEGRDFLWKVRFGLHILTGRREDRLLFDYQRTLAAQFGYHDDRRRLAVEYFMRDYYRTIMELSRLNEMLLQLFQEALLMAHLPVQITPINTRFQARNGFVEVTYPKVFQRYPFALLEVFLILQQHRELKGVRASTIRLIRDNRKRLDEAARCDIRTRSLFLEIIKQPHGLTHELRRMNRYGVLAAYLPAFGAIVGQMQYDLFHVYTVDEHTLFVIRNLRRFTVPEHHHEFPLCSQLIQRIAKPELLYLAGLFHDIAKGRGGDHSVLGEEEALRFCSRLGLSQYDARFVAWLVRNHLVMSATAQRRDISDPDVINEFAALVGDQMHLKYLYLLTVADIRATSPSLWNGWKDALLKELYHATLRALRRGLENPIDKAELLRETREETGKLLGEALTSDARVATLWDDVGDDYFLRHSPDEAAWHTRAILKAEAKDLPLVLVRQMTHRGGTEVFVHMQDMEGLFATATAALDQLGLTIMDARIITSSRDLVLDTFIVLEAEGEPIADARRVQEIAETLRRRLQAGGDHPVSVARRPRRQLKHFTVASEVTFTEDAPNRRTVMEVVTTDRPGLLSQIAAAMAGCGIRIQNAKIATFGERAEDVFFVTDNNEEPLSENHRARCRDLVITAITGKT